MSSFTLQSSNPALNTEATNPFSWEGQQAIGSTARADVATFAGVINRTTILVSIALLCGVGGYALFTAIPAMLWIGGIASLIATFGIFFAIRSNPARAVVLGPIYAIVQGTLLGGVTGMIETMLTGMGIDLPGGLALQALIVTGGVFAAMLFLYRAGIVRPSNTFVAILSAATMGIMIAYLVSFVLSFFMAPLPFISLASVFESGTAGLIGLGLNLVILVIASMWLAVDFRLVEETVERGAPRAMEWYLAFALLVTLAWIYLEAVKLIARIAVLLRSR